MFLFSLIVTIDLIIDEWIHMGIQTTRSAISDTGDKMSARRVFFAGSAHFGTDHFLCGISLIYDGGIDTAHQRHPSIQLFLEFGNIILRQNTLPDIHAQFHHIFHDGFHEGVCMVHYDHTFLLHVAV